MKIRPALFATLIPLAPTADIKASILGHLRLWQPVLLVLHHIFKGDTLAASVKANI